MYRNGYFSPRSSGGSRIFLRGGATPKVGVLTYYFANFLPKMHENERIWTLDGGRVRRILASPLDPSLKKTPNLSIFSTQEIIFSKQAQI